MARLNTCRDDTESLCEKGPDHVSNEFDTVCSRPKAKLPQPSGLHTARRARRKWFTGLDQMIDLAPPTGRWTIRREAVVVSAVRSAVLRLASSGSTEPRISAPPVDPPTTKLSTLGYGRFSEVGRSRRQRGGR